MEFYNCLRWRSAEKPLIELIEKREPYMRAKILTVMGTRPEAIKMAPVLKALSTSEVFESHVCATGQHRDMFDQVLEAFDIRPDFDLAVMRPDQDLTQLTCRLIQGIRSVLRELAPDRVLVQGDTTTTFAASLAAFYEQIPVAHVEAGLRTHNSFSPWPEEINRRMISVIADLHFAPTPRAKANLLREAVPEQSITVTGNTVVDALLEAVNVITSQSELRCGLEEQFHFLDPGKRLILVTGHRRESFGAGFENICQAIAQIARRSDVEIVYPVHLNPHVREPVHRMLKDCTNVFLIKPLNYLAFVHLMTRAHFILTDSGGIQEEAPALGKPVLIMRDTTERPEAVAAGSARLVGTDSGSIVSAAEMLLDQPRKYDRMSCAKNPFGDGRASHRIVRVLENAFKPTPAAASQFRNPNAREKTG